MARSALVVFVDPELEGSSRLAGRRVIDEKVHPRIVARGRQRDDAFGLVLERVERIGEEVRDDLRESTPVCADRGYIAEAHPEDDAVGERR